MNHTNTVNTGYAVISNAAPLPSRPVIEKTDQMENQIGVLSTALDALEIVLKDVLSDSKLAEKQSENAMPAVCPLQAILSRRVDGIGSCILRLQDIVNRVRI